MELDIFVIALRSVILRLSSDIERICKVDKHM